MIRRTKINLNYATNFKKSQLDLIFIEYKKVVNLYIDKMWQEKSIGKFIDFKVETWLSARMQQAAGKVASQVVRSVRKKDKNTRYKSYKKVYKYFKERDRQTIFLSKKYSELNLKYKIKPEYKADAMDLDYRFFEFQTGENSFDIWLKMGSIGNKIKFYLPSKRHSHFNKFHNDNWNLKKSIRLYKHKTKGYFCDLFFEKLTPEPKETGNIKAIDIGINKLIATSSGETIGTEIKELIQKLHRRKQKSKRWYRTIEQIKNYIGQSVNQLDLTGVSVLVMEKLTGLSNKKTNKNNKTIRKLLGYWNWSLLEHRIKLKCELDRVRQAFVCPVKTSQECPVCHHIDQRNRSGEHFQCVKCGHTGDADTDIASLNILERYRASIVPCAS